MNLVIIPLVVFGGKGCKLAWKTRMTAKEALSYAIHAELRLTSLLRWSINTNDPAAKKELQELADWRHSTATN